MTKYKISNIKIMVSKFFEKIAEYFELLIEKFYHQGPLAIGIFVFFILIFVLSILLLKISSQPFIKVRENCDTKYKKNLPGMIFGSIILIFSLIIIVMMITGRLLGGQFGNIYIFGIGGIFFFILIVFIIAIATKNDVQENFAENANATGPCQKDGELGTLVNGICITKSSTKVNICEAKLDKCKDEEKKAKDEQEKQVVKEKEQCKCDEKFVSRGDKDGNIVPEVADIGICEYKDIDGTRKFGYSHPAFGKKCVTASKMSQMLKSNPKYGVVTNKKIGDISYNPFQSTLCYGNDKENLLFYDLKCKDKFGQNYGLKSIEGFGCPSNDNRGMCEIDYQMGQKLEPNSTKCVPLGTDMNVVCNKKHQKDRTKKYMKMGYKSIEYSACPSGYQRAICDGNYYDGKELFENTTEPFPQSYNPNRMCKTIYGPLSFAEKIISENCVPGYIRATCVNRTKR